MQAVFSGLLTTLLVLTLAKAANALWGSWGGTYLTQDSYGYLAPVARAIFENTWDHVEARPFVYPFLVYIVILAGGTLNTVVAIQVALYLLGALVLYRIIRTPAIALEKRGQGSVRDNLITKLIGVLAVGLYFGLSNHFVSLAFYLWPELMASFLSLLGLYASLQLVLIPDMRPARVVGLALSASLCSALLVGLKPSYTALAVLLLAAAIVAIARQRRIESALSAALIVAALSLPSLVLIIDQSLARKYEDSKSILFGYRTAFCNNADLIASVLDSPEGKAAKLLGKEGARRTAAFLRGVQATGGWKLLGFNGDHCLYTMALELEEIEDRYFGDTTEQVASTHRKLLSASLFDNPIGFLGRVIRQLAAFLMSSPPIDCVAQAPDPLMRRHELVDRLMHDRSVPGTSQVLPRAPFSAALCESFEWTTGLAQKVVLIAALLLVLARRRISPSSAKGLATYESAIALCAAFWIASALVVAAVHSFDVYRYLSVTLPFSLAALGLSVASLFASVPLASKKKSRK